MAAEVLGKCPVCNSETEILKIGCDVCGTVIEGHFSTCKFCKLTQEQKTFIDIFIKCRGNIKEVEKELGISYPTVKNKLEDVAGALGYKTYQAPADTERKREILEKLNRDEITFDEALNLLKE